MSSLLAESLVSQASGWEMPSAKSEGDRITRAASYTVSLYWSLESARVMFDMYPALVDSLKYLIGNRIFRFLARHIIQALLSGDNFPVCNSSEELMEFRAFIFQGGKREPNNTEKADNINVALVCIIRNRPC
ncbi:hypothetical protein BGX34_005103 [Mortierella sp. NVP85]|nr:hypothetical protein BGX34_005103 [Mortierella sp. NVP85]